MDESLVNAIHAAFPAERPPARPVTDHRCCECDEIDEHLKGRTWLEVATEVLPEFSDALPLLTPAAQAYYLPAYMCFEVRSPGYMAGLLVLALLERQVRRSLKGKPLYGLYPEGRPSPAPTGPAILESFSTLCIVIADNGRTAVRQLAQPTATQRRLLQLLDLPPGRLKTFKRRCGM
jgi:hypothetical protein